MDDARALLVAKVALEAELVRPLGIACTDYLMALDANGGQSLPAFERMGHVERLAAILRRHYARVAMVVTGRRPPRTPSLQEAALSLRHMESMINRATDQARRVISGIDREISREIARQVQPDLPDDGTGSPALFKAWLDGEVKADREKVYGVTAGMIGRMQPRLGAIANVNTNGPAEEARLAQILDETDVVREGERLFQTWNSLLDGRERPTHHVAHGQMRPIDEPFEVGGALLRFPGDSSLGAPMSEVINCRCFLVTAAVDERGNRRLIHTGPSAPARRQKRPHQETIEEAKPRLNPTANIRLNGNSRANLVLHDKDKTIAQLRQVKPNLIEVRVGNRVIARADTDPARGTVTRITVDQRYQRNGSDVEGIIRRSVQESAKPRSPRP